MITEVSDTYFENGELHFAENVKREMLRIS